MITIFIALSALGIILPYLSPQKIKFGVMMAWSFLLAAFGFFISFSVFLGNPIITDLWFLNASGALFVSLISFIQMTATLMSIPYLTKELHEGVVEQSSIASYYSFFAAFVTAMLVAVLVRNSGFTWVAIEATTLATTFLVAFYKRQGALEAAWKYLIVGSTGISLALIGILLVVFAGNHTHSALDWDILLSNATMLDPTIMKVAFVFLLVGFGTKVGLVPMHSWLPDAHSQAPSPISAMLSGVLLPVALLVILRFKTIVDTTLGNTLWTSSLLLVFAVISVVVAAGFILSQRDYKRLLAYSSIEHMGISLFAFSLGGALLGVLHIIGHALAKSGLFFGAGNIITTYNSTKFEKIHNVSSRLPKTTFFFIALMLGLLAIPPSPLFLSEISIIMGGLHLAPVSTILIMIALVVVLAGFIRSFIPMFFSASEVSSEYSTEKFDCSHIVLALHFLVIMGLGIYFYTSSGIDFLTTLTHFL